MSKTPKFDSISDGFTMHGETREKDKDTGRTCDDDDMSSKFTGYDIGFSELESKSKVPDPKRSTHVTSYGGIRDVPKRPSKDYPATTTALGDNEKVEVAAQLNDACLAGQLNVVKDIVEKHYIVLMPDSQGRTPLYAACIGGHKEVIEYLVERGYDVNHQDYEGKTPLHVALESRQKNIWRVLTHYNASHWLRDARNWTPLHCAIDNGYGSFSCHFLKRFLEQDLAADVSWMHLQAACLENKLDTVKRLLDNNADVNHVSSAGLTALYIACRAKHHHVVECLLLHGADPNSICHDGETSLHAAVRLKQSTMVQSLLACPNIDINIQDSSGYTPLHRAVHLKEMEIIGILLENDPNLDLKNLRGVTALQSAINEHDEDIVMKLLEKCPDVPDLDEHTGVNTTDRDGDSCLHLAIRSGCSMDLLRAILDRGAHVDAQGHSCKTALALACCKERDEYVDALLKAKADPNIADEDGETSLHWAVHRDCTPSTIQSLIDHGAKVNARDSKKRTALQLASNNEVVAILLEAGASREGSNDKSYPTLHAAVDGDFDERILQGIVDQGADLDALNKHSKTALIRACEMKNLNALLFLLKAGADPNIPDKNGNTAIHWAVDKGCDINIIRALIQYNANVDYMDFRCRTALQFSFNKKRMDVVTILLEAGADPNIADKDGDTILHLAVHMRHTMDVFQMIIKHKAQVNAKNHKGMTALQLACISQQNDLASLLLKSGADPNVVDTDSNTCLHIAVLYVCNQKTMQLMIQHGVKLNEVNNRHHTALYIACIGTSVGLPEIGLLLESGADVNIASCTGKTCLHQAVVKGRIEVVKLLMNHPIDINAQTEDHDTPLMLACHTGITAIAVILMEKGADVNIPDDKGNTALHITASQGREEMVDKLLEHGANVNARGQRQMTPLHAAVCREQPSDQVLNAMLQFHPDVNLRNSDGDTALHMATRNRYINRICSLLQHGADAKSPNNNGRTPFECAVHIADHDLICAYIKQDTKVVPSISGCAESALYYYCKKGKADIVKLLVDCGTDLHTPEPPDNDRPITVAFKNGHTGIVRYLVDSGVNVSLSPAPHMFTFLELVYHQRHNYMELLKFILTCERCVMDLTLKNREGETLLYRACWSGAVKVVELLLGSNHDIGINICNPSGKSPLSITCETANTHFGDSLSIAAILLYQQKEPVDVNSVDSEGKSALHRACEIDRAMLVNILLYADVGMGPINLPDASGKTPLSYAKSADLVNILIRFGAKPLCHI